MRDKGKATCTLIVLNVTRFDTEYIRVIAHRLWVKQRSPLCLLLKQKFFSLIIFVTLYAFYFVEQSLTFKRYLEHSLAN